MYCCSISYSFIFYCFFFNATATTESYTYLHTLSLHDALPIFSQCDHPRSLARSGVRWIPGSKTQRSDRGRQVRYADDPASSGGAAGRLDRRRSEEHTSELQSLMRISYAVFCLKKTNKYKKQHCTSI